MSPSALLYLLFYNYGGARGGGDYWCACRLLVRLHVARLRYRSFNYLVLIHLITTLTCDIARLITSLSLTLARQLTLNKLKQYLRLKREEGNARGQLRLYFKRNSFACQIYSRNELVVVLVGAELRGRPLPKDDHD